MITVAEKPVSEWKDVHVRMHPEVHLAWKIASALEKSSMENLLHQVLCDTLPEVSKGVRSRKRTAKAG